MTLRLWWKIFVAEWRRAFSRRECFLIGLALGFSAGIYALRWLEEIAR